MGKIRLACLFCDRDECYGVNEIPATWFAVDEVQCLDESLQEASVPGDEVFTWWTHLGVCPDCLEAE